jgi:spermidine/putrescine transport system substrate-binding protein
MMPRPLPADPMVRQAQQATMGRRTLLAGAGAGAAALALAACSTGGAAKPSAAADISDTDKTIRWDNWALYIDVDAAGKYPTLEAFTTETGIKVAYTEAVDDNNTYYGKVKDQLALGKDTGADVACLTDWMVGRLIRFGYLQGLDHANIPNLSNLLPSLQNVDFDPDRSMSVPWQGGLEQGKAPEWPHLGFRALGPQPQGARRRAFRDARHHGPDHARPGCRHLREMG